MICVVGTNLRSGFFGFLKRGQSQRLNLAHRIFRAEFPAVGGLPIHGHHMLVCPQQVLAARGGRLTGGPVVVEIHEIDDEGNASSRAVYVNSEAANPGP